ncbi:MAG: YitT family protein [Synergistaceae bacterium]|nr:YitT family protein [Synergistaceae bacterium]
MHNIKFEMNKRGLKKFAAMGIIMAKAEWSTLLAVIFGCVVYTFGVMSFTIPFQFPDSGVTGIAILLKYAFGFSLPLMVGIANLALLVMAWRELSPRVVMWTVFSVALITVLMKLMNDVPFPRTDQKLLVAVISGVIKGYGGGLVFHMGASMGGLDIVSLYMQKKYGVEVGRFSFYINMFIIGASTLVVGTENAMLGLVSVFASSFMTDSTLSSFDKRRLVMVITKDPDPVLHFVTKELGRGVTVIESHGGYSGEDRPTVMCVLTRRQSVDLKRFIGEHQPNDFVIIADANEVVGKGFKPWKPR